MVYLIFFPDSSQSCIYPQLTPQPKQSKPNISHCSIIANVFSSPLHFLLHCFAVLKLLSLPPQPPYVNLSQRPVLLLWKYLGMAALQGPVSAGRLQMSVHCTTGGQGARTHWTFRSEQLWQDEHPPLSMEQEGSQKASPVGLKILQREPAGHFLISHGSVGGGGEGIEIHNCA